MGRVIVNQEIVANRGINKFQLDLSNLANGLYSYNFKISDKIVSKKLLIADF